MEPDSKIIKEKIKQAGLQTPRVLTFMVTGGCNLNCPHCLLNCDNIDADPVPRETILKIVDEFSDIGGETLIITGGEPLIHPEWFDILNHACNLHGLNEITLQTNGVMVTGKVIEKLKTLPRDKFTIQVSIDGATPGVNDLIRGEGNFEASMIALKHFAEAGMGERIKIAFTEMRHNFHEIPEMLKLVKDLGIGQFISGTVVKGGRAENADWINLPDKTQVRELIERYESDSIFRGLYDKFGNISAIEWLRGRDAPFDHVCNCISAPFISAAGKMYPCAMYLDDSLSVDNVLEQGLKKGILNGLEKWSSLPLIDRERSESLAKCKECIGKDHCRGGCVGRAQAIFGDPMNVEDRCELRREIYYYKKMNVEH
ncbi:radical SAM protein [Thermodesulfobacteriota bacterium]